MSTLRLAGALVLAVAGAAGAQEPDKAPPKKDNRARIVGLWEVPRDSQGGKGSLPPGATVEFTREGELKITLTLAAGKKATIVGAYKLSGNKFDGTYKQEDGVVRSETFEVVKLTDKGLVTRDEKGGLDHFKRVR
jgi:uncharacterized protein (TIGR03066 family)